MHAVHTVVLTGNPNVGKTSVFNAITGLRQKVGNYPGVTVERKIGRMNGVESVSVVDLPGMYSLNPKSLDEEVAYRVLTGRQPREPMPDVVVCVVDATNLERNLYFVLQIIDLGLPTVVALNMIDAAKKEGLHIDTRALGDALDVPVIPMSAITGEGVDRLKAAIVNTRSIPKRTPFLPAEWQARVDEVAHLLAITDFTINEAQVYGETVRALTNERILKEWEKRSPSFFEAVKALADEMRAKGVDPQKAEVQGRYDIIGPLVERVTSRGGEHPAVSWTDRLDAILTHRVVGPVVFLLLLLLVFQAVFAWAAPIMDFIETGVGSAGEFVRRVTPAGVVQDLLVDGVIAGVGSVLVFLPQILLLFFFIGLMEDTGYMARAAFISDRLMNRLGLSGRSVVPLVSSYACAVPAIMATRTIDNQRDRLVTMMVIPLMSCSARLPVYTLLIGAFIPAGSLFGIIGYQGGMLLALYLASTGMALTAAYVLKKFVIKGDQTLLALELPSYRLPQMKLVLWRMVERSRMFVTKAGKIILLMSIVLWFLASFPRNRVETAADGLPASTVTATVAAETLTNAEDVVVESSQIRNSYIGRFGRAIEPVMRPLGFDWKISAGIISAFAAREVIVSTLATLYSVEDDSENNPELREQLRADVDPVTGKPVFSTLVAISLMVFIMLACQCMSTLAITRRETNSWRWPIFMFGYMTLLAYLGSLFVYQGGKLLGLG